MPKRLALRAGEVKDYLTFEEAKSRHQVSNQLLWDWVSTGVLPHKKGAMQMGGKSLIYVLEEELIRLKEQAASVAWIDNLVVKRVREAMDLRSKDMPAPREPLDRNKCLLTLSEVAAIMCVHRESIYKMMKLKDPITGEFAGLAAVQLPGISDYRFHPQDVADFIGLPLERIL